MPGDEPDVGIGFGMGFSCEKLFCWPPNLAHARPYYERSNNALIDEGIRYLETPVWTKFGP